MDDTFAYLAKPELTRLNDILVEHFPLDMTPLFAGLSPRLLAQLPIDPKRSNAAKIWMTLQEANSIKALTDGSVPIEILLYNASTLLSARPVAEELKEMLAAVRKTRSSIAVCVTAPIYTPPPSSRRRRVPGSTLFTLGAIAGVLADAIALALPVHQGGHTKTACVPECLAIAALSGGTGGWMLWRLSEEHRRREAVEGCDIWSARAPVLFGALGTAALLVVAYYVGTLRIQAPPDPMWAALAVSGGSAAVGVMLSSDFPKPATWPAAIWLGVVGTIGAACGFLIFFGTAKVLILLGAVKEPAETMNLTFVVFPAALIYFAVFTGSVAYRLRYVDAGAVEAVSVAPHELSVARAQRIALGLFVFALFLVTQALVRSAIAVLTAR